MSNRPRALTHYNLCGVTLPRKGVVPLRATGVANMQQIPQSKIEAHCLSGPFFVTDQAMARIGDEEGRVLAWFNQRGNVRSVGDDVVIPGLGLRANFWFDESKPNGECFGVTIYTKADDPERPMGGVVATLKSLEQLLLQFYETPSLATPRALPLIDAAMPGLSAAIREAEKLQSVHDCEHPEWPRAQWREAVAADETLQGYWQWVAHRLSEPQEV